MQIKEESRSMKTVHSIFGRTAYDKDNRAHD